MAAKGYGQLTAAETDSVIGISGAPIIIYYLICRSDADGAAVIEVRDGNATTNTLVDTINVAAASTTVRVDYGTNGLFLPSGCFLDVDGNTAQVTAVYEMLRNA